MAFIPDDKIGETVEAPASQCLSTCDLDRLARIGQRMVSLNDAVINAVGEKPLARLIDQGDTINDKPRSGSLCMALLNN
nr:hypothetical protein [Brucella intermedia]